MIGGEVVIVEDPDVEDGVVGADAHVADGQQAEGLDESITPLVAASLRQGRSGEEGLPRLFQTAVPG